MTKPLPDHAKRGKASKLREEDVRTIRRLHETKEQSVVEMARFYGVNAETVRRAIRGESWNNLHMSPPKTNAELEVEAAASLARMQAAIAEKKLTVPRLLNELTEGEDE